MKKVTFLLVLVALVASVVGTGAADTFRLIRLDIINDSGDTVYMKLEGDLTEAYYYLTVPDGEAMTFTIETDLYERTTWACGGVKNTGKLEATSNIRLKFTECFVQPMRRVWIDDNGDGIVDAGELWKVPNYGEPTMEKVVYYETVYGLTFYGNCGGWLVWKAKIRSPKKGLCYWRYRY